jgi:hypothetical protein
VQIGKAQDTGKKLRQDKTVTKTQELAEAQDFPAMAENFLSYYPQGFADPSFDRWERQYKEETSRFFLEKLNNDDFCTLLNKEAYSEICRHCVEATSRKRINLLHPVAHAQLKDAINYHEYQKPFSESLFRVLYEDTAAHFDSFIDILLNLEASSWPRATIFLFLTDYTKYPCVLPENIKAVAKSLNANINYDFIPSWQGYSKIIDLCLGVNEKLLALKDDKFIPKDMIDINSFLFMSQAQNRKKPKRLRKKKSKG